MIFVSLKNQLCSALYELCFGSFLSMGVVSLPEATSYSPQLWDRVTDVSERRRRQSTGTKNVSCDGKTSDGFRKSPVSKNVRDVRSTLVGEREHWTERFAGGRFGRLLQYQRCFDEDATRLRVHSLPGSWFERSCRSSVFLDNFNVVNFWFLVPGKRWPAGEFNGRYACWRCGLLDPIVHKE